MLKLKLFNYNWTIDTRLVSSIITLGIITMVAL